MLPLPLPLAQLRQIPNARSPARMNFRSYRVGAQCRPGAFKHNKVTTGLVLSLDGSLLASAGHDGLVGFLRFATGKAEAIEEFEHALVTLPPSSCSNQ